MVLQTQKTKQNLLASNEGRSDIKGTSYYKDKVFPRLLQRKNPLVCHYFNITNSHLKGDQLATNCLLKTTTSENADFSLKATTTYTGIYFF